MQKISQCRCKDGRVILLLNVVVQREHAFVVISLDKFLTINEYYNGDVITEAIAKFTKVSKLFGGNPNKISIETIENWS